MTTTIQEKIQHILYYDNGTVFPEWLLTAAELLTALAFLWVVWEVLKLVAFFWRDSSKLARLKTQEFLTDALTAAVTIAMGLFLFLDWSEGVKGLIVLRPLVGVLNAIALRNLYNHFRSM